MIAAAPPLSRRTIYALHASGYAAQMRRRAATSHPLLPAGPARRRSSTIGRSPGSGWSWRSGWASAAPLRRSRGVQFVERDFVDLRVRMRDSMQLGRLFLAGDAAQSLITPAGGKGMNLAVQDAIELAAGLCERFGRPRRAERLERYSATRLPAVWQAQEFSNWLLICCIRNWSGRNGLPRPKVIPQVGRASPTGSAVRGSTACSPTSSSHDGLRTATRALIRDPARVTLGRLGWETAYRLETRARTVPPGSRGAPRRFQPASWTSPLVCFSASSVALSSSRRSRRSPRDQRRHEHRLRMGRREVVPELVVRRVVLLERERVQVIHVSSTSSCKTKSSPPRRHGTASHTGRSARRVLRVPARESPAHRSRHPRSRPVDALDAHTEHHVRSCSDDRRADAHAGGGGRVTANPSSSSTAAKSAFCSKQ